MKRRFLMPLVTIVAGLMGTASVTQAKPVAEVPAVHDAAVPQAVSPSTEQPSDFVITRSTATGKFAQHRSHSSHSSHSSHRSHTSSR